MPTFEITSPSGERFQVTAPEGATEQQVLDYARQNMAAPAAETTGAAPRPNLAAQAQSVMGSTTEPETWQDVALGGARGVAKEAASFLPLPMNPFQPPPPSGPPTMEGVVSPYLGQSEGPGAQMAERAGRYTSGAILPGGMVRRGLSVALPAAGGEAGRALGGPIGEAVGAVTGGLASGVGAGRQLAKKQELASQLLRSESKGAYNIWDQADITIKAKPYQDLVDDIRQTIAKEGVTQGLHDATIAAYRTIAAPVGQNVSAKHVDLMRQVAKDVTATPSNARLGRIMGDKLDDFLDDIVSDPKKVLVASGDPTEAVARLREGRALWQDMRRTEAIEGIVNRAQNRSGQFTQSGMENALRTEFRQLSQKWHPKDPSSREAGRAARARNMWTQEQRTAIERVAQGGKMDNFWRAIGRFAPKGPVSSGMIAAMSSLIPGIGPAVAGAVAGGAALGHRAARSATERNVERVYEAVSRGRAEQRPKIRGQALGRALLAYPQE